MDNGNEIKPTEAFDVVNQYLGWGEAVGGLWFVGLEEAADWGEPTEKQIAEWKKDIPISPCVEPTDGSNYPGERILTGKQIRAYTCKIAQPLSKDFADSDWQTYRARRFWRPGCGLLQINLFPLGKPHRSDWPEHFKRTYGFGNGDQEEYRSCVERTRFRQIADFWETSGKPPVVTFGMEGWASCKTIFGLDGGEILDGGKVVACRKQRVILAPFFSYWHMSNSRAKLISDTLKEWGVTLP